MSNQSELQLVNEETGEVYEIAQPTPFIPKVKNWLNYHTIPHVHEVNTYPSLTIPDQSLTVNEILERYSRGLGFDGMRVDIYQFDDEGNEIQPMPDMDQLDYFERVEALRDVRNYVSQLQQELIKQEEGSNVPDEKKPPETPPTATGDPLP